MGLGGSKSMDGQLDSVYWAAYFGRIMELRQLLDAGATNVNQREREYQRTPLIATAFKDRWESALLLLERGAQVEDREESLGCTALMIAAQYNSLGVAQVLLDAGADLDASNEQHGQTALMWCCQYDHAQMASLLISRGASVSKQRKDTVTPLMIAAKNNAYSVAALLLDTGADPNLVGNGRFTSLMICAMVDSLEVAQLLLRHGAEKAALNREGKTALIICAENNSIKVAQLLLDTGADPDAVLVQENRHSPATISAFKGHLDLLKLLVEHGANYKHRCVDGRGLAELAASSGNQSLIQYVKRLIGDAFGSPLSAQLHWASTGDAGEQQGKTRLVSQPVSQVITTLEQVQLEQDAVIRCELTTEQTTTVSTAGTADEPESQEPVEEDAVVSSHWRPLGPNTVVTFEQQLLDDQRRAGTLASAHVETEEMEGSKLDWQKLMESEAESETDAEPAVEEEVVPQHFEPLGPNTFVPFEKQLLDEQRREERRLQAKVEKTGAIDEEAVGSCSVGVDAEEFDKLAERQHEATSLDARQGESTLAASEAAEAVVTHEDNRQEGLAERELERNDPSPTTQVVEYAATFKNLVVTQEDNQQELLCNDSFMTQEPVDSELLQIIDAPREMSTESFLMPALSPVLTSTYDDDDDDQRQVNETESANVEQENYCEAEVTEDAVTPAQVRPLDLDCEMKFENLLQDQNSGNDDSEIDNQIHAEIGGSISDNFDQQEALEAREEDLVVAESAASSEIRVANSRTTVTTKSNSSKTTVSQQEQKKPEKRFQNKKYTVTRKIITTETTGQQVNKREQIVKINITSGDVSESVCQTEGPTQSPKWKDRRDTESLYAKLK